jgi:hypothetical protein
VIRELNAFVQRRLVTTDTANGSVVVGVVHEAFLSAWPPLADAITENASALRACRAVEQAAAEWDQDGHPASRLWERGHLAAALADLGAYLHARDVITDHDDLSLTARDFLHASHHLSEDQIQQSYRHDRRSCPTATVQRSHRSPPWMASSAPTGLRRVNAESIPNLRRVC